MQNSKQQGFTLLEILVAFTLLALTFASVMEIISGSAKNTVKASQNTTPPNLSQLTANPTSVLSGGSSTISWTLSGQATSCTKTGDWSGTFVGSDVTDGTHSAVVSNIVTSSTYRLQCSNSTGSSALLSTGVTVTSSANCTSQPPILNGAEDTTILANNTPNAGTYDGTFQGFQNNGGATGDWPGSWGESISLSLTTGRYISASFTTNNLNQSGRFQFSTPGNLQGPASAGAIAISECPGDFATHLNLPKCQKLVGPSGSFKWSTDPSADPNSYCKLEKNTPYYLNIVHSITPEAYTTSACTSSYCGILAVQVEE